MSLAPETADVSDLFSANVKSEKSNESSSGGMNFKVLQSAISSSDDSIQSISAASLSHRFEAGVI